MIKFNKKQVKGIIDVLKSEPCKTRPALQTMRIKRDGFGYITNGYLAIRYKFEIEPIPKEDSQEEFIITLDNLTKWYKLANYNDYLDELTILGLQDTANETQYPDVSYLFEKRIRGENPKTPIRVNGKLIDEVIRCVGSGLITIEHFNECIYIKFIELPIDAIVMEIR